MLFIPPAFAEDVAETGHAPSLHDVYTDIPFFDVVVETHCNASLHDASVHAVFTYIPFWVIVAETQLIASVHDASVQDTFLYVQSVFSPFRVGANKNRQ